MRIQWLSVCMVLGAASAASAQYGPAAYSPYYYGNPAAQRYYNPYGNAYYSRPQPYYYPTQAPTYYSAPRYNYTPYRTVAQPGPMTFAPSSPTASSDSYIEVQPQATRIRTAVPMGTEGAMLPPALDRGHGSRVRKTSQVEELMLPPGAPAADADRSNVGLFFEKVCQVMSTGSGEDVPYTRSNPECVWGSVSYLAAFIRPMQLRGGPLVSTGSLNDNFPGSLGQPTTRVLFGNDAVDFSLGSGASVTLGVFLDSQARYSLDGTAWAIFPGRQSVTFVSDTQGNPLITRPVRATDDFPQSFYVAVPTLVAGSTKIDFTSNLGSAEMNGRYHGCLGNRGRYDFLIGARYARLQERMQIEDNYSGIDGFQVLYNGGDVSSIVRQDIFGTTNHFVGGQIGARLAWDHRWLNITGFAKIGLGATIQQVDIEGSTTGSNLNATTTSAGGILALPTNIGNYQRTVFSVLPEAGVNFGINVTEHVRLQLGYSGMLWNRVVRPGSAYTNVINSGLSPTAINFGNVNGTIAPNFRFNDEVFWVHSLSLGVECHY